MNLTSKKYLSQVKEVIKKAEAGEVYPVYLFIGDRPIIHPQINKLIDCLVSDEVKDFNFEVLSPDFKPVEFDGFKKQAGLNSFTLTPKRSFYQ
jgi:hypothetical protein